MAPTRCTAVNLLPHAGLPAVQGLLAEAGIALEAADDGGAPILEENTALPD